MASRYGREAAMPGRNWWEITGLGTFDRVGSGEAVVRGRGAALQANATHHPIDLELEIRSGFDEHPSAALSTEHCSDLNCCSSAHSKRTCQSDIYGGPVFQQERDHLCIAREDSGVQESRDEL